MPTRWFATALLLALLLSAAACRRAPHAPPPGGPDGREPEEDVSGPPFFEDLTDASGVRFTYRNGQEAGHLAILESLGGGVALIDYDGDGLLDLFFPGGGHYDRTAEEYKKDPKRVPQIKGRPCKLYKNLGGFRFRDVTGEAGLEKLAGGADWFYSHAAAVADYDRDGFPDLLVTGWGRVALFHNVPDGKGGRRFEDVTARAGLDKKNIIWATSAAWADLDGDGYPDLYVCQYTDWSWKKNPPCSYDGKTADVCPPKQFEGLPHLLYRNTGKGTFVDVGKEAGLRPGGPNDSKGLGVLIVDVDGDGKPDVYVANDTVDNFLYMNRSERGRLRFEEVGLVTGVARDDRGTANGSMGVDAGDPARVGRPYLWVTNYENELHALYRNESQPGSPFFHFHTTAAGIAAIGQKYVGWGTGFVDVDLDGWEDLFVANGHAIRFPTGKGSSRKQLPVLLRNTGGGRFRDVSPRIGDYHKTPHLARGVGLGDLDNDGRTDLVVSHMNDPAALLRGVGGQGQHWLGVRLEGKGHACVVGARAVFESGDVRQTRFAKGGGSYASSGDRRLLFGLGAKTSGRLTVTWPDGTAQHFDGLAVDRYYRVTQGREKAEEYPPRRRGK